MLLFELFEDLPRLGPGTAASTRRALEAIPALPGEPRVLDAGCGTGASTKVLAEAQSDRILGCHIIGPDAGALIHEAVVAMEFGGSAEDLGRAFHGHPTLNEAVKEAALNNISTLRTQTCFRTADGRFFAFEGSSTARASIDVCAT